MTKMIFLSITSVLVLTLVIPVILALTIRSLSYQEQTPLNKIEQLYEQQVISQTFTPDHVNFYGVGVSIKNPNFSNRKELFVKLYDLSGANPPQKLVLSGKNIPDGGFMKLYFKPIKNSSGKPLKIEFSSPYTTFEEMRKETSLGMYLSDKSYLQAQELQVTDSTHSGSLAMVLFYKPLHWYSAPQFIFEGVISRFLKDQFFSIFYLLLVMSLVAFVLNIPKRTFR